MKKSLIQLFVCCYLAALAFGVATHAVGWNVGNKAAMYFFVWDMYGGYSPFEERRHLLAEGESGTFYDLSPPWGEFVPFGAAERGTYDFNALFHDDFARCTLAHTDHEPIVRVFHVDEVWNRKFNLSEAARSAAHAETGAKRSYYYLRGAYDGSGTAQSLYSDFSSVLAHQALMSNPQLQGTIARSRPYTSVEILTTPQGQVTPAAFFLPSR